MDNILSQIDFCDLLARWTLQVLCKQKMQLLYSKHVTANWA